MPAGRTMADSINPMGANFLYPASGLFDRLLHMQAGELYIFGANETKASGFYPYTWEGYKEPTIIVTPVVNPSGDFWITASGVNQFTVTFATAPSADESVLKVANWIAI